MSKFALVFLTSFLISVAYGATIYVNSTFLEQFFSYTVVSGFYVLAALGNIVLFFLTPKLLRRFRKETLLVSFVALTALGTLGLSMAASALSAGIYFTLTGSLFFINYYYLDIALEALTVNRHTGGIRGLYWTFLNGGIAIGPLLVSLLVKSESLKPIYLTSFALLVVALISTLFQYSQPWQMAHQKYHQALELPFRAWWRNRNVRAVTLAKIVLEAFFTLMTIYTPIYLHQHLGFAWSELGIIFTIMLLPFVILEWPAGEVADYLWGEKEMMTLGFFLMGVMLLSMPFLKASFGIWTLVLLVSRIGASLVEITTESYFFKKISAEDTGMIGIFRLTRPVSLILGAVIGALIMRTMPFEAIFLVTGIIVFFGMKESLYLRDTK